MAKSNTRKDKLSKHINLKEIKSGGHMVQGDLLDIVVSRADAIERKESRVVGKLPEDQNYLRKLCFQQEAFYEENIFPDMDSKAKGAEPMQPLAIDEVDEYDSKIDFDVNPVVSGYIPPNAVFQSEEIEDVHKQYQGQWTIRYAQ